MSVSQTLLVVEDLHVRYGGIEVLKGIDLRVEKGKIVALIGANGAGKTTTLVAISGLVPAAHGTIHFAGQEIQDVAPESLVRKGLVHVPEGRHIFPRLTVLENLLIGAQCREDHNRVGTTLEQMFQLFPILKQRQRQLGGTLSGGEQQMLALARGLMASPKLLLLDEPSLGLAPKLVAQLFEVIRQIHALGVSILLVEQNAYQALHLAETAYLLETGRVVLQGTVEELRKNPLVKEAYLGGGI